ncbi:MAG: hypothetical protein IJ993_02520 [Akkermansia sp.]|nr:hypothetical protein [Akkermansia sp.]
MSFLSTFIKWFLLIAVVSIGYFVWEFSQKQGSRKSIQNVERVESLAQDIDSPVPANKYVKALRFPSLKARSEELRLLYNRRERACDMAQARLQKLYSRNLVSRSAKKWVELRLDKVRELNAGLLSQYKNIVDFAERQYANDIVRHDSAEDEARAAHFEEQNARLMKTVEEPLSFL